MKPSISLQPAVLLALGSASHAGANLVDERPIIYRQNSVGSEEVSTIQPRTYGVSFSYGF